MLRIALLCLAIIATSSPALAQIRKSDQFYTNADGAYAWTVDTKKNMRTTMWFAKNPTDAPSYQQMTAVIYDRQPEKVLYLDKATKRVVGQLDLSTEKFSLLTPAEQKTRQAIDKFRFPTGSALPRVEEMFEPLPADQHGNTERLKLPPPTLQFPRLEHSTWQTSYMSADRFLIRSELQFDGDTGTYRLTEKPGTGRLSEIKYERDGEEHLIHGNWNLGRASGYFRFHVPAENLNVFWGEFGFQEGRSVGAWDGVRTLRPALKDTEKPVR